VSKTQWKLKDRSHCGYTFDHKPTLEEVMEEVTVSSSPSQMYWKWEDIYSHKINCIKDVKTVCNSGLKDSKELVDWCYDNKCNIKFVIEKVTEDDIPF
jgi:ribosomal protein L7/L12